MRGKLTAIPIALAAALLPVSASASGISITLGSPMEVTARVLVPVPVSVVCSDVPGFTPFEDRVEVRVEQAIGTNVSRGTGIAIGGVGGRPLLFTCDGVTVNSLTVSVLADPNSSPFHGGPAVVSATATRLDGISCGPGCFFNVQFLIASVAPTAVKLRG